MKALALSLAQAQLFEAPDAYSEAQSQLPM